MATDVPIEWLEIPYIRECSNQNDLASIISVLRSGKEGVYPHLEAAAEKRMRELNPKHRILRKEEAVKKVASLGESVSASFCFALYPFYQTF
jgi:hypothetical protein